jgi:hypothetical protein
MKLLAQLRLPGTSGTPTVIDGPDIKPALLTIPGIISELLPIIFTIAGLILFAMLVWGGYDLLLSGGDSAKAQSARGKITTAFIGFFIVFISFWVTRFILQIFHLE